MPGVFYRNPPLVTQPPLFGEPNDGLLVLWRVDSETAAPCFRIVRPIGDWKWGECQHVDLDFVLPATVDELAGLKFEPTDEDLGLEIPFDDQEGGPLWRAAVPYGGRRPRHPHHRAALHRADTSSTTHGCDRRRDGVSPQHWALIRAPAYSYSTCDVGAALTGAVSPAYALCAASRCELVTLT